MENILSKRNKNLILISIIVIIIVLSYFTVKSFKLSSNVGYGLEEIKNSISYLEKIIKNRIKKYLIRVDYIKNSQLSNKLTDSFLKKDEALIETKEGIIEDYKGAIHYFKFVKLSVNNWKFIEQNGIVYFIYRTGENSFYIRTFCSLSELELKGLFKAPYLIKRIKFINESNNIKNENSKIKFEKINNKLIYLEKVLSNSNGQLLLYLKFSAEELKDYLKNRSSLLNSFIFLFIIILSVLLITLYKYDPKLLIGKYFLNKYFSDLVVILLFLPIVNIIFKYKVNNVDIKFIGLHFTSIYQISIILFLFIIIFYKLSKRIKQNIIIFIMVNILFPILYYVSFYILENSTISIRNFSLELGYIFILISLFLLFLLPFLLLRNFGYSYNKKNRIVFFIIELFLLLFYVMFIKLDITLSALFTLPVIVFMELKRFEFIRKILFIILIAGLISVIVNINFTQLKKAFVDTNLKMIFLNQENYSKLVIGEIIEELELSGVRLKNLFNRDNEETIDYILADIWNHSLASKEEIASGIYILDKDKEVIGQFSYKIPYLKLKPTIELPVWTTEETSGILYGKELSVSFGLIKVNDNEKHLGYIVIEVLNSPQMILKNSGLTIFGLDKKLKKAKLNYLKLKDYKIIENPQNINLKNIVNILKSNDKWFQFNFMDTGYDGYIFKYGENSIIIFSPRKKIIESIAEIIKITVLFLIFLFIFSIRNIKWRNIGVLYYSLSSRIFIILTLVSIISIFLFSVFTADYYKSNIRREFRDRILRSGRVAQNLIGQVLTNGERLTQNDVFFVSSIINSDIHVFEDKELTLSSNFKDAYKLKIPTYIHSNTLGMLGREKQNYFIEEDNERFNLFFQQYNYIFQINYFFNKDNYNLGRYSGIDFIITLFSLLFLSSLSIVLFVRNKIMAPILYMNKKMSDVEKGKLDAIKRKPIEVELKTLYNGFNSMLKGIEAQKRSVSDIARMKTIIKFGRRVAHEIKNPLTPIKLSAEQILKSINDKRDNYDELIKKSVNYIINETEHLRKVSYGFLDLSHIDDVEMKKTDLISLIEEQIIFFKQSYPNIEFNTNNNDEKIEIKLDKLKITQLLKNIIINAIEAIEDFKGKIDIEVYGKSNGFVIIKVIDNGIGIDIEDINLLFNEDYSTKKTGTGIGLFVAKRIVDLHKGKIDIKSIKGKGTKVIISLPIENDN